MNPLSGRRRRHGLSPAWRAGGRPARRSLRAGRRAPGPASVLPFLLSGAAAGCGLLFPEVPIAPGATGGPASAAEADAVPSPPPSGVGTLLQEDVSLLLRRGDLQVLVTPLTESIVRVTAPDTYQRLSALRRGYQEIFREETGSAVPFELFLVSLHSEFGDVAFEPEALAVVNRGLRYRPIDIRPLTPDWDQRRLGPRQSVMAIYAFSSELDLERPTEVEYQEVRSREWDRILARIEAERTRVGHRLLPD